MTKSSLVINNRIIAAVKIVRLRASILQTADMVALICNELKALKCVEGKIYKVASEVINREPIAGFSPRYIQDYVRLSRSSISQRNKVRNCKTLHAATAKLGWNNAWKNRRNSINSRYEDLLTLLVKVLTKKK